MTMALVWWIGGGNLTACVSIWGLYFTAADGYQDQAGFHPATPFRDLTQHGNVIEPFTPRATA